MGESTTQTPLDKLPKYIPDREKLCLSREQAEIVYEAVENGEQVKPVTVNSRVDVNSLAVNPYAIGLRTNTDSSLKKEPALEMKKCDLTWSILSTEVDYTESDKESPYKEMNHSPIYSRLTDAKDMICEDPSDLWQEKFEEVSCNLYTRNKFDDNNDVSTTYFRYYKSKGEERTYPIDNHIPIDGRGVTEAFLMDSTPMKLFFDSGASRSYLSKKYYDANKSLHKLPKFGTTCTGIKIGNGSIIPTLFVIPVQFMTHGHVFEIYAIVAEIDDGMDLVFGFKNMAETEGRLNTRTGEYDFIGRSIPVYPQNDLDVPANKQVLIKIKAPFGEKLSGRIIAKLLGSERAFTIKIRIENNQGCVQFVNKSTDTIKLRENEAIGILDLRSIGYFKVSYQKLITMAESRQTFKMYHYQQVRKDPKGHLEEYHKMSRVSGNSRKNQDPANKIDKYPWLDKDDPRRHQTDAEILYEKIDLKQSALNRKEKAKLMKMILKYRDAFSLRDEIGECPNLVADIKVIDESPFFVRPFPLSETDKPFMDQQMERLVSVGILTKNSTSHTSPVMLITRKLTNDKRPVVDFRLLNTRILRRNTSIPLMSDVLSILGNSECEVMSCVDIKDAYHSIKLTEKSKEYCGILPYFGSPIYRYEVLSMGITCAPQIWMDYITLIMAELEQKNKYIAIMDDLLLHSTKVAHWKLLEPLFQSMCKNGLKLSPKKCQLFRTKLTYMGNEFNINKRTMTITPLRSRTEAVNEIPTPRTAKQCKSFCGVVNYLSLFCPDLQTLLKPIVELTRKGRPFVWGQEQEKAFKEVKLRLTNPPVLHLPKAEGRFILYSDTSVEGTGSSLWQMQEGKAKLIGYASKTLPEACSRYSVTELEMTGLLVNMNLWKNLLKHREFDAAVDHVAVTQVMKAKTEPATTRIMRLLDRLSAYSFNLYYVKGRDMILADYISRHRKKDMDPSDLIPISFCCMDVFRRLLETDHALEVYNISTRSSTKASGEKPPEVHGADKPLDPNLKPEHQSKSKLPSIVGNRSPSKTPTKSQSPKRSPRKSVTISEEPPIEIPVTSYDPDPIHQTVKIAPHTPEMVAKPVSNLLPPPSPITQTHPKRVLSSIPEGDEERESRIETLRRKYRKTLNPTPIEGIDVGDSEEVLDPQIRIPDQSDFELPPPLHDVVDPSKITHKFLPKQGDIDRLINQINKKVLRDTKLSMNLRDLRAAYLQSPHFRDIYLNLTQNRIPLGKGAAKRLEQNARNYMILDGLLFKIIELEDGRLDTVLCIPTSKVHILYIPLRYYWRTFRHHKVLSDNKSEILLPQPG